jgi:hypothetical protein
LIGAVATKGNLAVVAKDISWLWRTAYNTTVSGCRDWDELAVAELFDLSREVRCMRYFLLWAAHNCAFVLVDGDVLCCLVGPARSRFETMHVIVVVFGHLWKV